MEYTEEMYDWYLKRTRKHIFLVSKYIIEMIYHYGLAGMDLFAHKETHDLSKFEEPEKTPYVFITWQYYCQRNNIDFYVPDTYKILMKNATEHHVMSNPHHPEFHSKNGFEINSENRDIASNILVDATSMPDLDICEMVADWLAVSEERNTKAKDWADNNIGIRWKFNEKQVERIYQIINTIEKN